MVNFELYRQLLINDIQETISIVRINAKVLTIDITKCNDDGI